MLENRLRDVSECWTPEITEHSMKEKNKLINQNFPASESLITHLLCGTYTAKVKDETIPRVEALPGHRDLCCSDCSPALDLEKPLHSYFIGNHMPEARSHATSLRQKLKGKKKIHWFAIHEKFLCVTGQRVIRKLQRELICAGWTFVCPSIQRCIPAFHSSVVCGTLIETWDQLTFSGDFGWWSEGCISMYIALPAYKNYPSPRIPYPYNVLSKKVLTNLNE